jgi:hypothetical protein
MDQFVLSYCVIYRIDQSVLTSIFKKSVATDIDYYSSIAMSVDDVSIPVTTIYFFNYVVSLNPNPGYNSFPRHTLIGARSSSASASTPRWPPPRYHLTDRSSSACALTPHRLPSPRCLIDRSSSVSASTPRRPPPRQRHANHLHRRGPCHPCARRRGSRCAPAPPPRAPPPPLRLLHRPNYCLYYQIVAYITKLLHRYNCCLYY